MPLLPRLFIASSSQSKLLANELASTLNDSGEVHAESWARPDDPENNKHLLGTLIEKAQTSDFAVVILTGDNVRTDLHNGEEVMVPRANCVFELGLFIGAFGKPERCFLLSSMEPRVLFEQLSDIGGQLHQRLTPPEDFANKEQCRAAAEKHRDVILKVVQKYQRFADRPRLPGLRIEDVLAKEARRDVVKADDVVLVKESRPIERKLRYARTVINNMGRPVNYLYLFGSAERNFPKIIEMLRSMLAAKVVPEKDFGLYDKDDNEEKKDWLDDKSGRFFSRTIQMMRKHMFIELIDDVEFDEFCIHSAGEDYGQGYVKIENRYVPVPAKDALLRFEHQAYRAKKRWPTRVIFEPNALDADQQKGIARQIREKFPEKLHDELIAACFDRESG